MFSVFRRMFQLGVSIRRYSSALYVTGDKASSNFAVLVPYVDFDERLENEAELKENLKLRGKNINLEQYRRCWGLYKDLDDTIMLLNEAKREISQHIAELMKDSETNKGEIEKYQLHSKHVKEDYKIIRDNMYPLEEQAVRNALSIPNLLDKRTPHVETKVLYEFREKPRSKGRNHIDIATESKLLYYLNPTFTVLENDAAMFEHSLINYVHDTMLNNDFVPTVNPSFCRSVVVEGCCTDFADPNSVFAISEEESKFSISKLHFVGNSNLYSFMAYFARFSIQPNYLPLKFFASGRQYNPVTSDEKSLFNLNQYSTIDAFGVTTDDVQTEKVFDDLIGVVKEIYDPLGQHYRLAYAPAKNLKNYESLRLSIQMYSSCLQNYIEIGNVSLCGDYLSKRLLVTYNEGKNRKYPGIVHGTLVNVQKILACSLENNDLDNKQLLSEHLRRYVPI